MIKLWALIACLSLIACQRKHDQVQEASQTNPVVDPPSGPVCTQSPWTTQGGISGQPPPGSMQVLIPNFDKVKGDTALFYYKPPTSSDWIPFREGFYADVTFTISGSTVTITNISGVQKDWLINAMIWTCK